MKSGQNLLQTKWQIQTSTLNRVIDYMKAKYTDAIFLQNTRICIYTYIHTPQNIIPPQKNPEDHKRKRA